MFNLPIKRHPTIKSCYLTLDDKYLLWKDEFDNWFWAILNESTKEYETRGSKNRTLNSCKFEVMQDIREAQEEQQLWGE